VAGIYVVYFGICKIQFPITDLTAIQLGHWYFSLDHLKKVQKCSLPGTDHIVPHLIEARCKNYILFAVRKHGKSSARSLQLQLPSLQLQLTSLQLQLTAKKAI
jgi:hypothetical protein